jgi:ribosomal protein S18 acetylase RimI-like enzyme
MDEELAGRVHRNLMSVNSWMGDSAGGALHHGDGELFFASASELPFLNGAMREKSTGDADDLLARARSFFFERNRGFVAFAWPGDRELEASAVAAGMFPALDRYPEMVCRGPLSVPDADVRRVETPADARAYWQICDRAYPSLGFPPGLFATVFEPEHLLDETRVSAFLGYQDDVAVACASVWLAGDVGMVGWVAAVPESRGRGLAAACTVRATNAAFDRGADVASLQASSMGEDLYRRLGYEELFSYRLLGAMPG